MSISLRRPKIIGIIGHARSGKDTIAERLTESWGFTRYAFADSLRWLLQTFDPAAWAIQSAPFTRRWQREWEELKRERPKEVRASLQDYGMALRELDSEIWVRALRRHIANRPEISTWVIPDVRQRNEAELIHLVLEGELWVVERPGVGPVNGHAAEAEIDSLALLAKELGGPVLTNATTIEELHEQVDSRLRAQITA